MNIGDYVRIRKHRDNDRLIGITKIKSLKECVNELFIEINNCTYWKCQIIKSSPNIIDLIEVGDYVNGLKVEGVNNEIKGFGTIIFSKDSSIMEDYIYSIVTKEQFENMEYKL